MLTITLPEMQRIKDDIKREIRERLHDQYVTVGIHEDDNARDSPDITNAQLGATHHFGASINHPGGTVYGYATRQDALVGKVRFLRDGTGFMEIGRTGPHQIDIPARPWLDVGVAQGADEYIRELADAIESGEDLRAALERVGVMAVSYAQQYMRNLKSPPNAPSTIARKGSSNPLIDTGALLQSVTFKVRSDKPSEGLE